MSKRKPVFKVDTQPLVGTFWLGSTNVELFGRAGKGGDFYFHPDDKSLPRIKVGLDYNHWGEVLSVLLHESFEYLCAANSVRFVNCAQITQASDSYTFHFNHNEMTRIIDDQAYFLAHCIDLLCSTWKQYRKNNTK